MSDLGVMTCPADIRVYAMGGALGAVGFALSWDGFFWLLGELGYVDGRPASTLVAVLFLTCMLVMCLGYGVGIAMFVAKRVRRRKK